MLEQAVEDALPEWAAPCRRLTDALAEAFLRADYPLPIPHKWGALAVLDGTPDVPLTLKVPEGFAFYGLYPEAYAVAADRWRVDHPGARVAVIGIRSIGTTLSAVVLAALRAQRARAYRLTLRPTGHPFAREATLSPLDADWALIVDEGPGLSGSSMAAAAQAAHDAGIPRDRIAFLPGHAGDPGGMASDAVRRWWRETPRVVTPAEALRWEGRTLEETLSRHAGDAVAIEELTGGRWRDLAYASPNEWPPVALPFERRKLLVTRSDGSRVLYKFVGLSEPLSPLGERGRGEGSISGFAPAPWIEGQPLTAADATPDLLTYIGRHIAAVSGSPLSPPEAIAAQERLTHLLLHNAEEAGLNPLSPLVERGWGEGSETKTAGDYRLAPHEWRRLPDGTIQKTNRRPATGDHTAVGTQPVAWDVAGAMIEWNLDETSAKPLLDELEREGIPTEEPERRFYRAAYAAFMMGLCAHCAPLSPEPERQRLEAARNRYREALLNAAQTIAYDGRP